MKMYAKTNSKWMGVYHSSPNEWTEVKYETEKYFPSGRREVLVFVNGAMEKADRCDVCYVF
jgi:hypothetical protein